MSAAPPEPLVVRPSDPETIDRATVVALGSDGSTVGRATLSRLYGQRAEITLELAPSPTVALALVDALEREARKRRIVRLEVDAGALADSVFAALRSWRSVSPELRSSHVYLTWPTAPVNS